MMGNENILSKDIDHVAKPIQPEDIHSSEHCGEAMVHYCEWLCVVCGETAECKVHGRPTRV